MLFNMESESVWTFLKNVGEPVVMYGTGNGGDKVFEAFEKLNISVSGVCASDGFVRNRFFHGFKVMPISYFEEKYTNFTVAVVFGSSVPGVMENIKALSQKHTVVVPCVPVVGNEIFDESCKEKHTDEINRAYSLLADEKSKEVFSSYINFQFSGKLKYLFSCETPENEAFINCIHLGDKENYVDIGAYKGDTVEKFLKYTNGKYGSIIAAEPDVKTFNKLVNNCGQLKNFKAVNMPVTNEDKEVLFSSDAGRQSKIGKGELRKAVSLQSLCGDILPSYIKADAEGEELMILEGGALLLKKCTPKMNIAAYHKNEDIFKIPILLNEISESYKIYLRHHPYIPAWDTNYYCEQE